MMESVLIANRGEIARRIIRTAKRLGVRTIAVYSAADADTPFVSEADQAVAIGAAPARDSYLDGARILSAAASTQAAAIHPGYGFLSENAAFAEAVCAAGLLWVGAPPAAIRAMGLKDAAKALMVAAGVPVTPGYLGQEQSAARLQSEAASIGYPILIKAVAGGGGKGMRRVESAGLFEAALASCRREAAAAFGDDRVLLEKYIRTPRHLEVQIFADSHGQIVHLFERDCSLQRRHQKVIEEAPAPGISAATRAFLCGTALKADSIIWATSGTGRTVAARESGRSAQWRTRDPAPRGWAGSMMPSSHNRAVAWYGSPSASYRARTGDLRRPPRPRHSNSPPGFHRITPVVANTAAACSPPMTLMRLLGQENRKRGPYARPAIP